MTTHVRRTRRLAPVAALALAALALAACSSGDGSDAGTDAATDAGSEADGEPGASTPATAQGSTAASAAGDEDPGVVVALDEFAAVAALTLGVTPDTALAAFGYAPDQAILAAAGVATEEYGAELDIEQVAALEPDVIIGVSLPTTVGVVDQLNAIAPTTVLDYTDTWQDQLAGTAAALDREERAEAVVASVEADLDALAGELDEAGLAGSVVSVVSNVEGFFSVPEGSGVGSVLAGAGLDRPAPQKAATQADSPFVQFSPETLPEHDGDQVLLMSGGRYDVAPLTGSPLWSSLGAVQAGAVDEVSGEVWLATSGFATSWVVDDLRRVLVEGTDAKSPDEAAAEFERFTAAVAG